jgi:type VI protein secretion system component Hcp
MSFSLSNSRYENSFYSNDASFNRPRFSNITVTRYPDEASSQLMSAVFQGIVGKIYIEFEGDTHYENKKSDSKQGHYFELEHATLLNISMKIDNEGNDTEEIEIGFINMTKKYIPFNIEGTTDSPFTYVFEVHDLSKM